MKLREFLQQQGLSRRLITSLIDKSKIFLNGEIVQSYGCEVEGGDEVVCEGKKWRCETTPEQKASHLLAFHKPIGYVCSKSDPHNVTIYQLLPKDYHGWYYIGRLDRDSRGLVLMTNDPKMVDQYEHPRHGITKEYLVTLNRPLSLQYMERCLMGIEDQDEVLKCIECGIPSDELLKKYSDLFSPDLNSDCVLRIVLNEGKKRHIRRMMSALRYHVNDLIRIREGEFELGKLKEGEWKIVLDN